MVMGTSGYLIDHDTAIKLGNAGIRAVAISLDSKDPATHDSFRGLDGVWERAVAAIGHCRDAGIGVQINMSVMRSAISDVEDVIELGTSLGVRDYQLFFPIPTGRARQIEPRSPEEYEDLIRQILIRFRDSDLNIRPTCAPQFRRIADESWHPQPGMGTRLPCRHHLLPDLCQRRCDPLPVPAGSAGNVRTTPFSEIWNNSPLFSALRNPDLLTGKCGRCDFKTSCGGCRARAYRREDAASPLWCDGLATPEAPSGECCGEDPWCPSPARRGETMSSPAPFQPDQTDLAILNVLQDDLPARIPAMENDCRTAGHYRDRDSRPDATAGRGRDYPGHIPGSGIPPSRPACRDPGRPSGAGRKGGRNCGHHQQLSGSVAQFPDGIITIPSGSPLPHRTGRGSREYCMKFWTGPGLHIRCT